MLSYIQISSYFSFNKRRNTVSKSFQTFANISDTYQNLDQLLMSIRMTKIITETKEGGIDASSNGVFISILILLPILAKVAQKTEHNIEIGNVITWFSLCFAKVVANHHTFTNFA